MSSERRRRTPAAAMNGTGNIHRPESPAEPAAVPEAPLAFEEMLGRLDETVSALESGQLSVEDSLKLFEEGMRLAQRCQEMLDQAELRVQRLRVAGDSQPTEADEAFVLESFDLDEDKS